jgi:hypothetical protein
MRELAVRPEVGPRRYPGSAAGNARPRIEGADRQEGRRSLTVG